MTTALAGALLLAVLVVAVVRPRGVPEAVGAVPAAGIVLATGLLAPERAWDEVVALAPVVGFLAAILVLAHLADADGVFTWAGSLLARAPRRLFGHTFLAAALTTAVLSLDATVVLLTPVVLATARTVRVRPQPSAYTCAHLANSASLLLPISNLTNLLALERTGLTFLGFTALMAMPWVVVLAVEYAGLRWYFRDELRDVPDPAPGPAVPASDVAVPRVALAVIAATLVGFAGASAVGVEPVWVALAGATVLGVRALARRRSTPRLLVRAASPGFCAFVLALGVVVAAVTERGLGDLVASLLPEGDGLGTLLAVAAVAALLSNLVNNLPATLILLAALGPAAPVTVVLAMLIGVGVGPNLTYVGSLATLLWRRVLLAEKVPASLARFTVLGLVTTPAALVAGTTALHACAYFLRS